ncbi:hypothetical protein CHA01nite_36570 [Chryseobacterium hagamense]|uniref:Uncharacterized protein n=2 Tax=Chryseobacterium hagamense TaxID=395935 RepID=A0A511YRU7_9FLAO|nr:hypothetical protein CHA01nite_36570 [Chryseobacterium hagamense]
MAAMLMIWTTGWNMLAAQAIYDPGNRLFVETGTVVHVAAADPGPQPARSARKIRKAAKPVRAVAVKKHNDPGKPRHNREAQESAHLAATGFAEKKGPEITARPGETRDGILVPEHSGKAGGLSRETVPFPASKILSAADIKKHKFLYRESYRYAESSYSNSCRPPPGPYGFSVYG